MVASKSVFENLIDVSVAIPPVTRILAFILKIIIRKERRREVGGTVGLVRIQRAWPLD